MSLAEGQIAKASMMQQPILSESPKVTAQLSDNQNLIGPGQKSQCQGSSTKRPESVVTLLTSKNIQSPQKLVEQLAKEKGFMNSPIIIVENISKVTSPSSIGAVNMSTARSPPNLYVSMPTPESTAQSSAPSTNQEVYKCEECDYSSHNKHYLKQHVDLVHCANRPYKCPFCNYAGKRSHSLREHLMVHSNERPYVCNHCHATFRKKGHLTNHVKLHQKMVTCPICKSSVSQPDVEMHMKTLHQIDKLYVCDVCSFMAINKSEIEEHLALHKNSWSQMYVCDMCNHRSKSFEQFCIHAETHRETIEAQKSKEKGGKENISMVNNKGSNSSNNSINEGKMMKCSECGFVSGDISVMKDHMMVHIQNERSIESNKNKQPSLKSNHEASKSIPPLKSPPNPTVGKSIFKCVECEFSCKEAYVFVVHMLTHRPDLKISADKLTEYTDQVKTNQAQPLIMNEMTVQTFIPKRNEKDLVTSSSEAQHTSKNPVAIFNTLAMSATKSQAGIVGNSIDRKSNKIEGSRNESSANPENPPFIYHPASSKFKCTVCGYTCDYQRTIKAHIWKHSGNKDIDYPMFQNGPLSIYEDSQNSDRDRVQNVTSAENSPPFCSSKTVVLEKIVQPLNKVTSVSPVVPVLANMLAMRAKQKDPCVENDYSSQDVNIPITEKQTASSTLQPVTSLSSAVPLVPLRLPQTTMSSQPPPLIAATDLMSVDLNAISEEHVRSVALEQSSQNSSVVYTLTDGASVKANYTIEHFGINAKVQSIVQSNVVPQNKEQLLGNVAKELQEKKNHEEVESRKKQVNFLPINSDKKPLNQCCVEERSKVVVETVDNTNVTSYTGMKSQQNSPQTVSELSQSEMSDSGMGSDSNTVFTAPNESSNIETRPCEVTILKDGDIVEDICTEVTISSGGYDGMEVNDEVVISNDDEETESSGSSSDTDMSGDETGGRRKRKREHSTSMTESAVTLLSLLKRGDTQNQTSLVMDQSEASNESIDNDDKPKQGISSSLLAVIEQLRERSKNESELEELTGTKKPSKKRTKKETMEDISESIDIENVEKIEDEGKVLLRCKLCHYTNLSTYVLQQHMRLHKVKQPFECSLCDFIAISSEKLQEHMIQHCKVRTYQCKLCASAFNYKSQLRAHMRAHTDTEVFVCDECDYETTNPVSYRNHVRGHHNEKKQYKCEVCDRKFLSKYELKYHKRKICPNKSFQCDECDFVSIGPQEQKQHAKIHNKEFKCAKCEYNTTSITRFENHAKIHDEPKTLKCELCDFPAVSNRSLKSHMKRHINDQRFVQQPLEQYKCNICGYVCHHLPSLKSHMWRHASDQNYSYEFTNEVINAAIDYDSRLDTYECQKDDIRAFFQTIRQKLKDRLEEINATGDPQTAACWVTFRCCQCGLETINKAELNVHMKSHSDIIKWTLQVNDKQKKTDK